MDLSSKNAISSVPALQKSLYSLEASSKLYSQVEYSKAKCKVLLVHVQYVLLAISRAVMENNCDMAKTALEELHRTTVSVWRLILAQSETTFLKTLLRADDIKEAFNEAHYGLESCLASFHLPVQGEEYNYMMESEDANRADDAALEEICKILLLNDGEILYKLDIKDTQMEEAMSVMQRVISQAPKDSPQRALLIAGVSCIQRSSGKIAPKETPVWTITTFDIDIDESSKLGGGGFAQVVKGIWRGSSVAVKRLKTTNLEDLKREADIWYRLRHDHIVPFYGASIAADPPFIVSRFMRNGHILKYVYSNPDVNRARLLHEVSLGMRYLHDERIVHGDVKGVNVLIDDSGKACITDFGLSAIYRIYDEDKSLKPAIGTLRFMAPEAIRTGQLSCASDVYAYAMLIYEVFTEEPPFLTESATDIRAGKVLLKRPISRTALKNGFTDEMWGLLLDCSSSNPEHRPKFARIVSRVALMANNWTREARPMVECASHSLRLSSSAHSDTLMDNAHLQTASQSLPQEKESLDLGQSVTGASLYHSFDIPPCHLRITENAIPSRLKLHDGYPAVEFVDLKHPCGPKKGSLVSLGENGFQALTSSGKDARWEHRGAVVTMIYLQHTTHVEYRFDQATHASQWFHLFKRLAKGRSLKSRPKGLFRSAVECPDTPVQVKWYWTSWFRVVAGLIMTTGTKEFHTDPPEQSWSQWRSPVVYSIDSSLSTHTSFTYVATSQEWKGTRSINVTLDGDLVEERLARDAEILRCWEYRFHTAELAHSWFHAYKIMVVDKFQTESSPAAPGAEGPMMSLDSNRNALGITSDSSRASRYTFVGSNEPYDLGVLIPSPEMTGRTSALHANLDHAYGGVATPTGTQLSTTAKPLPRVPVVGKVPPVTLVRYHVRMRSALDSLQIYKRSLGQIVSLCGSFVQSFAEKTSATNLGADDMTTASAWYKRVCEATERYINYDVVATLIRATHMKQELHELYFARPEVLRVYGSAYFPTRLSFRPDLDETLDAYRAAVASSEDFCRLSSLQGDESQLFVEYIDKILDIIDPHDDLWKRSLHLLRNLCGTNGICPLSFIVPEQLLQKQNDRPMASGGFCDVWRGIYRGHDVALKVWRVYRKETIAPATLTNFCKEAAVCKHLRHPNIVSFYGIDTTLFPLCLVCEWMPLGTIADYLTKQPTANRLILLVDIVAGLSYLHDVDIMHGDLKGSNVLVNRERKACLADFGLASFSHDSKLTVLATRSAYVGSMRWTAPEIMDPEHFGLQRAQLDRRTDMYSLAMVMWEVFTGSIPFSNLPRDATVMNKVLSGGRPDRPYQAMGLGLTDDVWEIMQRCWEEDLSARPAACDVLIKLRKSSESAETLKIPQQWPLVM